MRLTKFIKLRVLMILLFSVSFISTNMLSMQAQAGSIVLQSTGKARTYSEDHGKTITDEYAGNTDNCTIAINFSDSKKK